jgi:hypothetical protein
MSTSAKSKEDPVQAEFEFNVHKDDTVLDLFAVSNIDQGSANNRNIPNGRASQGRRLGVCGGPENARER